MNAEETARCQQAIALANSGHKKMAYERFCVLYNQGNAEDVTLLYWIAYTTPSQEEAYETIATLARLEPDHPKLPALRTYVSRRFELSWFPLTLHCPYCHAVAQPHIAQKISVAGWICFVVILVLFFPLCWIGLLMKKPYYVCSMCGIVLGDIME